MVPNEINLQIEADLTGDGVSDDKSTLLGRLIWTKSSDKLACNKLHIDHSACTKLTILSNIASSYDVSNFNMPLLNRARSFMRGLQCRGDVG